nr:unnamed protein product [Digitaria exilis]
MDVEGGLLPAMVPATGRRTSSSWRLRKATLLLAYQSFGVVYGDLCISPVYVYKNTFSGKLRLHEEDEEILGVLSLVFWSLTLMPLLKYIILVLGADDNGEGGTFALYSLMCRHSRMGLLNNIHERSLSAYNLKEPREELKSSLAIKGFFEKHYLLRVMLLLFVLMGTSMVIGDGVFTPTMSVLSAVSGLRIKFPELHESAEAMFADLGHFSKLSLRLGFTIVVYPCLVLAYMGEAAYLSKHREDLQSSFYKALPVGFRDTEMIGNAYGLAVILVMFATTCLMFLVITTVWNRSVLLAGLFTVGFGSIELMYLSACLAKVPHGGWLPLLLSLITLMAMSTWHYGTKKKEEYELQNKVCLDRFLSLSSGIGLVRVPGVGFVYSSTINGVPPMFAHFVTNFPAFHRVLIFVSIQTMAVPKVSPEERFLVGRVGPPANRLFRCVARYGYKEGRWDHFNFENQLLMKVVEFLQLQHAEGIVAGDESGEAASDSGELSVIPASPPRRAHQLFDAETAPTSTSYSTSSSCEIDTGVMSRRVRFEEPWSGEDAVAAMAAAESGEVKTLMEERESGVSYMIGQTCVQARESSPAVKRFTVDVVYGFLRRNSRRPAVELGIPNSSLIEVGMTYRV